MTAPNSMSKAFSYQNSQLLKYYYTSSYDERLSEQGLVNFHIRNIQQLYTIKNPRDLDSQLPKTLYIADFKL